MQANAQMTTKGRSLKEISGKGYTKVRFSDHLTCLITDDEHQKYEFTQYLGGGFEGEVWKIKLLTGTNAIPNKVPLIATDKPNLLEVATTPSDEKKDTSRASTNPETTASDEKEDTLSASTNPETKSPVDGKTPTDMYYAIKFEIGDIDIGEQLANEFKRLSLLDHPLIVKPVKYWLAPMFKEKGGYPRGHMMTEAIDGQSLKDKKIDAHLAKPLMLDLIDVVKYLNETAHIYHGDLNDRNIVITQTGKPILVDFGFSRSIKTLSRQDLKDLGVIYLLISNIDIDDIVLFKHNLEWYTFISYNDTLSIDQLKAALPGRMILTPIQQTILLSFFNESHDQITTTIKTHWV